MLVFSEARCSWQVVASLVFFYIPLVQQVANLNVVIDLSGCQLIGNPKCCELVGKLVGNPGCQPGLATSFQLVHLVGCGLYAFRDPVWRKPFQTCTPPVVAFARLYPGYTSQTTVLVIIYYDSLVLNKHLTFSRPLLPYGYS